MKQKGKKTKQNKTKQNKTKKRFRAILKKVQHLATVTSFTGVLTASPHKGLQ